MPHFVIEFSADLEQKTDIQRLMQAAYEAGVASGIMLPEDIKVRALPYRHYRLAVEDASFVHVGCHLLAGRTPEQKVRLAELVRRNLAELLPEIYSISVDVIDMDPEAYKKRLLAP